MTPALLVLPALWVALMLSARKGKGATGKQRFARELSLGFTGRPEKVLEEIRGKEDAASLSIMEEVVRAKMEGRLLELPRITGMDNPSLDALVMAFYQLEGRAKVLREWARVLTPYGSPEAVGLLLNKAHAVEQVSKYGTIPGQSGAIFT